MAAAVRTRSGAVVVFLFFSVFGLSQSLFSGEKTFSRKLSEELYPNSTGTHGGELLHVKAVGDNDTLHYLFSSQGAPALLLVHTNTTDSTVKVNWTQFLDVNSTGGLWVEPESSVLYSTAVVFSRLLEYDDVNNTAEPSPDLLPPYELQDFSWSRLNQSGPNALLCGSASSFTAGDLCLQLEVFGSDGHDLAWPRLLHSANSSQLRVWLDGVLPRATHSRFLLELQAVGGTYPLSRVDVHQSIDDEFTPSIFKVSQWVSQRNGSSEVLGFAQWKPVGYRRPSPALEDATPCHHSAPQPQSGREVAAASALIRAFYSEPDATGLNISFGLAGEQFYNNTKFLSWTLLVGVGSPPVDSFSPMVVAIMAVGLGTPVVLLVVGGLYVCHRKRKEDTSATYEPIN